MSPLAENIHFFERTTRDKPFKMPSSHFHAKHELYILLKGSVKYLVNDELYMLLPGDMIFVEAGKFHLSDTADKTPSERVLISFDDEAVNKECRQYLENLKQNKYIRMLPEYNHIVSSVMDKMTKEDKKRSSGYEIMQLLYLNELLIVIDRYRIRQNSVKLDPNYLIIQSVIKYISENCHEKITLEETAHIHSLSAGHLSKQFKKVTGINFNEYLNIARISRAEHLLLTTNLSVTDIAFQCGFNNSSYFTATFKKIKGITPKKYSMT